MNDWTRTIFRHETQAGGAWYSCAVAGKDADGEDIYEYWPVDFPKGTDIADRTRITFKDFTVGFYTRRDGEIQHKFIVKDFIISQGNAVYPKSHAPRGFQKPARAPRPPQTPQKPRETFEQIDEDCPF